MELRHLRYFLAVAETRNFTRAAQLLGIQQPPLSQQVRDLERELGHPLFRRLPRGVELTEGGVVFRREAQAVLAALERGVKRAEQAAHGMVGSLALGFTTSAVNHRFPPELVRRFREAHGTVELSFRAGNAALLTEAILAGRLDVAFIRRPVSEQSQLTYQVVAEDKLLIALPIRHRLAMQARERGVAHVNLKDMAGESFILVRRPGAPGMYGDLIDACRQAGFAPKVAAEVEQMLTNIMLVAAGLGVSAVPASMKDIHRDRVFYAEAKDVPQLRAPLSLVTRVGDPNPAVERFVRFALDLSAAEAPAPARKRAGRRA